MLNTDLMQFKDEMLKYLRELEKKIMIKINKNKSEISTDINTINDSIKLMKDNNNSLIESMAEQQVNIDKFSDIERSLKKINSTLTHHENRIDDSVSEITYIRNRCEKSINETLSVPGIIGKNCKYFNFNDYINNSIKELTQLKTEKDWNKKEFKELKLKLNQGLKNLSNLIDCFNNRAKMYTDNTKKNIIELMETKINELSEKNVEIMSKICKIDTDTEEKLKKFEENIEELNKTKDDKFQVIEDKLLTINNSFEEMNKNISTLKDNLDSIKVNEEKNKNEINELKNLFKEFCNKRTNITNKWSNDNLKVYQKDNYLTSNITKYQKSIKFRDTYASSKNNYFFSHDYFNTNNNNNNQKEHNKINVQNEFKSRKMKIAKTSRNNILLSSNNSNNMNSNTNNNNNKNVIQTNNNSTSNINSKILKSKTSDKLSKQEEIGDENRYQSDEISQTGEEENISNNLNKNIDLLNKSKSSHKYNKNYDTVSSKDQNIVSNNKFSSKNNNYYTSFGGDTVSDYNEKAVLNLNKIYNNQSSLDSYNALESESIEPKIKSQESIILNHLMKKRIDIINNEKMKHKNLPAIKNRNKKFFSHNNIKNNLLNNDDDFLIIDNNNNNNKKSNLYEYYKYKNNNKQMYIDNETGAGCKVVKLSFDDNVMTPYNTNGLLTIANKKYLNKHLIKIDESTPLDDIYINMYKTYRNNSYPKKKMNSTKTSENFNSSIDKIDVKPNLKMINSNIKFHYGNVKFHLNKK
jgi:hypothetical protein